MSFVKSFLVTIPVWCTLGVALAAEEANTPSPLALELNTTETVGPACRLTFVVENGLTEDLNQLVLETVLFTTEGRVALMTLFDFGDLPKNRKRVRQFQVPNATCDGLNQVLINGVQTCEASTLSDQSCAEGLSLTSRTEIDLAG